MKLVNEYDCSLFQSEFIDTNGVLDLKKFHEIIPVANGLVFEGFDLIELSIVNYDISKKDPAREKGANSKRSDDFATVIRNGHYRPLSCIPPVFDIETKELPNGRTRYKGSEKSKRKFIFVAKVRFVDFDGKPASYWRKIYASNANEEMKNRVDDATRTPGDISFSAANTLLDTKELFVDLDEKGNILKTDKNSDVIWDTLKDLGQNEQKQFWLEQTWAKILDDVECIETYSPDEAVEKIHDILDDIVSFSTSSSTSLDDNGNIHVIKKFQPSKNYTDRDYDIQLYELVRKLHGENPHSKINVYIHFDKLEASRLDDARDYKVNKMFLDKYNGFTREIREEYNIKEDTKMSEHFSYVNMFVLPQKSLSEVKDEFVR